MTERERLFGTDLQVADRAGGVDFTATRLGDLNVAQGNENIIQALTLRLRVRKGELTPLGWPEYGSRIHELIGEPNLSRTHVQLMVYAREAIEQDPRVQEIESIQARVLPGERNVVRLTMEIILIHEQNPLNLVYDAELEVL